MQAMPNTTAVERMLTEWGQWSRHDLDVGPQVGHAAGSLEGLYRSPQPWDDDNRRRPRVVPIADDQALRVEKGVVGCGPILAASLRAYFIHGRAPRRRMEVEDLRRAIARVGELLAAPQEARNRRQSSADEHLATRTSPQSLRRF